MMQHCVEKSRRDRLIFRRPPVAFTSCTVQRGENHFTWDTKNSTPVDKICYLGILVSLLQKNVLHTSKISFFQQFVFEICCKLCQMSKNVIFCPHLYFFKFVFLLQVNAFFILCCHVYWYCANFKWSQGLLGLLGVTVNFVFWSPTLSLQTLKWIHTVNG